MYEARLNRELDVINQMGFPGYFLIVMEFIQWAKQHNIAVGPGRARVQVLCGLCARYYGLRSTCL